MDQTEYERLLHAGSSIKVCPTCLGSKIVGQFCLCSTCKGSGEVCVVPSPRGPIGKGGGNVHPPGYKHDGFFRALLRDGLGI